VSRRADTAAIELIGRALGLHRLSLAHIFDADQAARVQHFDGYTSIVLRTLTMPRDIEARPLSLFLGDGFVVTVADPGAAALEPVRERLRRGRGNLRERGADYLAFAIVDAIVDQYFPVLEAFDDNLESIEDVVLEARDVDPIMLARSARQDLQTIRHAVWPAWRAVGALLREDLAFVSDDTRVHLRACHDHVAQLQEMVEASREIAASLLEAYISTVSVRTNDVMKFLTVIATLFIPLTFITGLYGMNFDPRSSPLNMPELDWYWGYPFALLLMVGTAAVSLLYFRRKGWLGGGSSPATPSGSRDRAQSR
jgi:magnesium transporter